MLYTEFNIEKAQEIWTKEAFEEGLEQGMIIKQIEMLKEFKVDEETIINRIEKEYNLTREEVEKYLK